MKMLFRLCRLSSDKHFTADAPSGLRSLKNNNLLLVYFIGQLGNLRRTGMRTKTTKIHAASIIASIFWNLTNIFNHPNVSLLERSLSLPEQHYFQDRENSTETPRWAQPSARHDTRPTLHADLPTLHLVFFFNSYQWIEEVPVYLLSSYLAFHCPFSSLATKQSPSFKLEFVWKFVSDASNRKYAHSTKQNDMHFFTLLAWRDPRTMH